MYKITNEQIKIIKKYRINYEDYPDLYDLVDALRDKQIKYRYDTKHEHPGKDQELQTLIDDLCKQNPEL